MIVLHVKNGWPVQFACQKQPLVPLHDENVVRVAHASPTVDGTPVHTPMSSHPATWEHAAPDRPVQGSAVPLHAPGAM